MKMIALKPYPVSYGVILSAFITR